MGDPAEVRDKGMEAAEEYKDTVYDREAHEMEWLVFPLSW